MQKTYQYHLHSFIRLHVITRQESDPSKLSVLQVTGTQQLASIGMSIYILNYLMNVQKLFSIDK